MRMSLRTVLVLIFVRKSVEQFASTVTFPASYSTDDHPWIEPRVENEHPLSCRIESQNTRVTVK